MSDSLGLGTGTVRAGYASAKVVRCCPADLRVVESSVSVLFLFDRALDEAALREDLARALAHVPAFAGRQGPAALQPARGYVLLTARKPSL